MNTDSINNHAIHSVRFFILIDSWLQGGLDFVGFRFLPFTGMENIIHPVVLRYRICVEINTYHFVAYSESIAKSVGN